jgi:hypothetical protein
VAAEAQQVERNSKKDLVTGPIPGFCALQVMTVPCSPFRRKPLTCNAGVTITYVGELRDEDKSRGQSDQGNRPMKATVRRQGPSPFQVEAICPRNHQRRSTICDTMTSFF